MSTTKITPDRLAEAVTRLGAPLQETLTPDEWAELAALAAQVQAAADDRGRRRAGLALVNWLADHADVDTRVHLELTLLGELRAELQAALAAEAQALGLAVDDLSPYVEAVLRGVQPEAEPGGGETSRQVFVARERATLVSLRNVWLRPGEMLEFVASAVFTAQDVTNQPSTALLGFGVLWLVRNLYRLATEEITGEDAAVLWGMWHACGRTGGQAPLQRIVEESNKVATQSDGAINSPQVVPCLQRLARLGVVELLSDDNTTWRLREKCRDYPSA